MDFLLSSVRNFVLGTTGSGSNMADSTSSAQAAIGASSNNNSSNYEPTILDVIVVKAMLFKARGLPLELVNPIIDFAEYWPHTTAEMDYRKTRAGAAFARTMTPNVFLIRSVPIGFPRYPPPDNPDAFMRTMARATPLQREHEVEELQAAAGGDMAPVEHPCRRVVFTIRSHDQGWGGNPEMNGTFNDSWTWFDAGLEKFDAVVRSPSPEIDVQGNDVIPDNQDKDTNAEAEASQSAAEVTATTPGMFPIGQIRSLYPVPWTRHERRQQPRQEGFKHHLLPDEAHKIQCNRMAARGTAEYRIVWSATDDTPHLDPPPPPPAETGAEAEGGADANDRAPVDVPREWTEEEKALAEQGRGMLTGDGKFVRSLRLGDMVTVWAKARFPAWTNTVEYVKIEVYWAI